MFTNLPQHEDDIRINIAIPEALEQIINNIAATGQMEHAWIDLRRLFRWKLCKILDQYFATNGFLGPVTQSFESRKREILYLFDQYIDEPPFTLQRIAEVLQSAWSQYRATHKLMNALVKLLSVSITITEYD